MADPRFFKNAGPFRLSDVAGLTGASLSGDDRSISDVAPLERANAQELSFLDNIKYLDAFSQSKAGACFVRKQYASRAPKGMALLITDEPYYAYAMAARRFYPEAELTPGISAHAHIAASADIGKGTRIDNGAIIGDGVRIGEHCHIGANTVIGENVEIGDHCRISALCSISHATLGKRVILHRGIHIGQDGFGFAAAKGKVPVKVPQLGRVLIGDDVEIGSGTCIDRGAGPDTVIGSGSKIDNLVQIGHNVQIGKHVFIAGQCGIAGSTVIGDGAMLGGQAGISGHVSIGAGGKLAAQAGLMKDVPPGQTYGGFPAMPMREWHRQTVAVAKLVQKKDKE